MAEKRFFEILDIMNVNDANNKTATVVVCNQFVSAKTVKQGGHVTMGVPAQVVHDLFFEEKKVAILLIIDKAEYVRIDKL